jgi:hypothetical protein
MTHTDIEKLLSNAMDTFKAFDNLTVENSGDPQNVFPTSIWQILKHLIAWQAYQLNQLRGEAPGRPIGETDTWTGEKAPKNEAVLQEAVALFKNQLTAIKSEATRSSVTQEELVSNLSIIQETSLHLSFHVGEVVLMRRIKGSYPMPHQMQAFLQE